MNIGVKKSQNLEHVAEVFKALGNPNRLRIYSFLLTSKGPENVSSMEKALGIKQSHLSQSLNILNHIGLVNRERAGSRVNYSINTELFNELNDFNKSFLKKHGVTANLK